MIGQDLVPFINVLFADRLRHVLDIFHWSSLAKPDSILEDDPVKRQDIQKTPTYQLVVFQYALFHESRILMLRCYIFVTLSSNP